MRAAGPYPAMHNSVPAQMKSGGRLGRMMDTRGNPFHSQSDDRFKSSCKKSFSKRTKSPCRQGPALGKSRS